MVFGFTSATHFRKLRCQRFIRQHAVPRTIVASGRKFSDKWPTATVEDAYKLLRAAPVATEPWKDTGIAGYLYYKNDHLWSYVLDR